MRRPTQYINMPCPNCGQDRMIRDYPGERVAYADKECRDCAVLTRAATYRRHRYGETSDLAKVRPPERRPPTDIDPVNVERLCRGYPTSDPTVAELLAAIDILVARKVPLEQVAEHLRIPERRVYRLRQRQVA